MIVQVINTDDDVLKSYLIKKYNLKNSFDYKEVIEIRNTNPIEFNNVFHFLSQNTKSDIFFHYERDNYYTSVLLLESPQNILNTISEIPSSLNSELSYLRKSISNYYEKNFGIYDIAGKVFDFNKAYLMGILNVTPDSFSDGGRYFNFNDAYKQAMNMIEDGVDIIDIGGESTRPGSDFVSVDEEKKRVLPIIESLLKEKSDLILSIDTTKSEVAESALNSGVKIVNDVSAMTLDEKMLNICSQKNATVVLMHMQGIPKTMQNNPTYDEVVSDIYDYLFFRVSEAKNIGIKNIIIDPGIGFGKTVEDNFTIIKRLNEFTALGYPILIGLSRKSFIGKTLNLDIENRDFPTAILETISIMNSARIIRTHNIKNGRVLVDLINKIL